MGIVGGFDIHRRQITFDCLDTASGEVERGRIAPADREHLRQWLGRFDSHEGVEIALEGCNGWRFVADELCVAGVRVHLAEPAETASLRGRKKRAKTDRADARLLRELLQSGRLPESWIPPSHVLEERARVRLYVALSDERKAWLQRIHATLFHHGAPPAALRTAEGEQLLSAPELSVSGRQAVAVALRQVERLDEEILSLRAELAGFARRQPGCRALQGHYGVGHLISVAIWEELGDCRRFSSSSDAIRHAGLDVTVYSSDTKRSPGHLSRQGSAVLRWALYEAGMQASKATSPDHAYFTAARERLGTSRAALSVGRKIARRCYHTLRELGEEALLPAN